MPKNGNSVSVVLPSGDVRRTCPKNAKKWIRERKALVITRIPFVIALKDTLDVYVPWTKISNGHRMNGSVLR
jgi:hypothetical protein